MREKMSPKQSLGLVTRIFDSEGYAWIEGTSDGEKYFCHAKAVRGDGFNDRERFFEGARVRFIATDSPKGPRALAVEPLSAEEAEVDGNREGEPVVIESPEEEDPIG